MNYKAVLRFSKVSILIAALFGPMWLTAQSTQRKCGTDEAYYLRKTLNPSLQKEEDAANEIAAYQRLKLSKNEDTTVLIVPVVFHIVHGYGPENISRQQILDQLQTLNDAFRKRNADTQSISASFKNLATDSRIQFQLATKDPDGNCTDGINRIYNPQETENADDNVKKLAWWDNSRYLNIWVVKSIDAHGTQGIILGYAQFPWEVSSKAKTDGIVVIATEIRRAKKTLIHEVGHWLGLFHTFQGSCTGGDGVDDTPPTREPNFNCPKNQNSCSNDVPNSIDMVENYMDYASCSYLFTHGQRDRMKSMIASYRSKLISGDNLSFTGVKGSIGTNCTPKADFYTNYIEICEGGKANFFDNSFNAPASAYEWYFEGGTPSTTSDKNPTIAYFKPGIYSVSLKVSNTSGFDTISKRTFIKVLPAQGAKKAPIAEDFERVNFTAEGWRFASAENGTGWQLYSDGGTPSGSKCIFVDNYNNDPGSNYSFTIPGVDISTSIDAKLAFKLAYTQKESQSADALRISVSTDCGNTFQQVFYKSASRLRTISTLMTVPFTPDSTQWRKELIDLKNFKGLKNLFLRFELNSGGGNNIYLDDIQIGQGTVGIEDGALSEVLVQIYPNPSHNGFTLSFDSKKATIANLEIYDMAGRVISSIPSLQISKGANSIPFTHEFLGLNESGLYHLRLNMPTGPLTRQISVIK